MRCIRHWRRHSSHSDKALPFRERFTQCKNGPGVQRQLVEGVRVSGLAVAGGTNPAEARFLSSLKVLVGLESRRAIASLGTNWSEAFFMRRRAARAARTTFYLNLAG